MIYNNEFPQKEFLKEKGASWTYDTPSYRFIFYSFCRMSIT